MDAQACLRAAALLALLCSVTARLPELLLPISSKPPCQSRNVRLSSFIHAKAIETGENLLPHTATNLEEFVVEVKEALDAHMLADRAVEHLFSDKADFHPTCAGIWAEFGVASGGTVNLAARSKLKRCSQSCPPVYGFDTFTGLPEKWIRDDRSHWEQNHFDQQGFPTVEPNVHLVKGLFNESLPAFLAQQAIYGNSDDVVSYLHVDCDLYAGSRDVLTILAPKLTTGSVVLFDDIVNYQYFRDHEMRAMWEWLSATGTKVLPIGMKGPLPGRRSAVELDWVAEGAAEWHHQSAAFVIAMQTRA